jgi:hypothetical protein
VGGSIMCVDSIAEKVYGRSVTIEFHPELTCCASHVQSEDGLDLLDVNIWTTRLGQPLHCWQLVKQFASNQFLT